MANKWFRPRGIHGPIFVKKYRNCWLTAFGRNTGEWQFSVVLPPEKRRARIHESKETASSFEDCKKMAEELADSLLKRKSNKIEEDGENIT